MLTEFDRGDRDAQPSVLKHTPRYDQRPKTDRDSRTEDRAFRRPLTTALRVKVLLLVLQLDGRGKEKGHNSLELRPFIGRDDWI